MNHHHYTHKKPLSDTSFLSFVNCALIKLHKLSQRKSSIGTTSIVLRVCRKRPEMTSTPVPTPTVITFVTGNQNKAREVSQILESGSDPETEHRFKIVSRKIDLPELQGEPDQIAREKCILAAKQINGPTVSALHSSIMFSDNVAFPAY